MMHKTQSKINVLEQQIQKLDLIMQSNRNENFKITERFVTEQQNTVKNQL